MPAAERGHVRGFRGVHEIAGRENIGNAALQRSVHGRPAGTGVDIDPGQPGQFLIGNPVAGDHERVAVHHPGLAGAQVS